MDLEHLYKVNNDYAKWGRCWKLRKNSRNTLHVVTSLHFSAVSSILDTVQLNGGHESDFATLRWPNNGMSYFQVFSQTSSSSSAFNPQLWNLTVLRILTCSFVWPLFRQRHLINNLHILHYYFYFIFDELRKERKICSIRNWSLHPGINRSKTRSFPQRTLNQVSKVFQ